MDETDRDLDRDPDRWLKAAKNEEANQRQQQRGGRLKIFFGYAAGVGKTYSMLQAARAARHRGVDVVAGYVEPHDRPKTAALLRGLEALPFRKTQHNGIELREFDLDAALERKPQLILLDEIAHTNAPDCRHTKRYLDVKELLKAGIDVYTTINVQHLESLHDTVASITGISVRERIPDSVFDEADQVELVDIEPQDLIDRLNAGLIYRREQAEQALRNFFTIANLTALREIALRRCADRVNLLVEKAGIKHGDAHTDEHILVGLSSSPSNARIIRTAARMAAAFRGSFTALLVETSSFGELDERDKKRLDANMELARRLGATIEIVQGDDIPFQIAEFARLSGVSRIVVGRSSGHRRLFGRPALTDQLIANAPDIDLHIIPDQRMTSSATGLRGELHEGILGRRRANSGPGQREFSWSDLPKVLGILLAAIAVGLAFESVNIGVANIITVFVLAVLIIAVITASRIYSFAAAVVSVLAFNFFFTAPRYTLNVNDKNYPITFLIMFAAAFISATLATRLKKVARQSARSAFRTQVLFETDQLLQQAGSRDEILAAMAHQLTRLLNRDVIIYGSDSVGGFLNEPQTFLAEVDSDLEGCLSENERAVAAWVFKNNTRAGATTQTLPNARCLYLAIRVNENVYGVAGIVIGDAALDPFEDSIVLSILGEGAMALENARNAYEKEQAVILARNEQLRADLLRAISHDLRTPLTSISGNAGNLLANDSHFDQETRQAMYRDIYDDAMWLINLVENLLSVTRLEEGRLSLKFSAELVEEVVDEALDHVKRQRSDHQISVHHEDDLLMARMDARLIVQVLVNLIDNAIKYTPEGSCIAISTCERAGMAVIEVADDGPGIPEEAKAHVFEMFYSGAGTVADSRRSLGIGLALCRSIVEAHGGGIEVADNHPRGAIFRFTLPVAEVMMMEEPQEEEEEDKLRWSPGETPPGQSDEGEPRWSPGEVLPGQSDEAYRRMTDGGRNR